MKIINAHTLGMTWERFVKYEIWRRRDIKMLGGSNVRNDPISKWYFNDTCRFTLFSPTRKIVRICALLFDNFLTKSVEIRDFSSSCLTAMQRCLQLMRMRCWTKDLTSNNYRIDRLKSFILPINWELLDWQSIIYAKSIILQENKLGCRTIIIVITWYLL